MFAEEQRTLLLVLVERLQAEFAQEVDFVEVTHVDRVAARGRRCDVTRRRCCRSG